MYRAREGEGKQESTDLVSAISEVNPEVEHFDTREALEKELTEIVTKDDVLLIMGAGDVTELASDLTK